MNHVESRAMQRASRSSAMALATAGVALAGAAVSVVIYVLHWKLAADAGYTSFCDVNTVVNCDVVLTSRYASLLGMPVAVWAAGYYVTVMGLALLAWRGGQAAAAAGTVRLGRQAARWSAALALVGLVFSLYMAVVAFAVIGAVCLMCAALYVVALALFVTTWKLRRLTAGESRAAAAARRRHERWVTAGAAALGSAVLAVAVWEAMSPGARGLAASEIAKRRPDFYRWYLAQPVRTVPVDDGQALGPAAAAVTIVEYSDFECGHCAALSRGLREALPRYGGQVRLIFRHFPLDRACNPALTGDLHHRACRAAVAAECAGAQQRFWPYHDLLFANQQHLDEASLLAYADRVGLDRAQFEACLASPAMSERVARDVRAGADLGVESTPTWFVNGRVIKGALDPELLGYALGIARASAPTTASAGAAPR